MVLALLGLAGCGAGKNLKIADSPVTQDGVTVTLEKASAQRRTKPDRYEYAFSGTIRNDSDEGIMKVVYTFALTDKNGEEFRSFGEVWDGVDSALPPHSSVPFSLEGIKWGAQSVPASVRIGISSVATESQLPAVKLPQPGDLLIQALGDEKLAAIREEPPAELAFHVDQGGYGRTAVFKEGEDLDRAVGLLCAVRIAGETEEYVTDNYNWIRLTWQDGSTTVISLNLRSLEISAHSSPRLYTLEGLDALWSFAADYLEEDG
jgi:hypothetical protein